MQQPLICPACHAANLPQARFCQQCGYDLILNNAGPRFFLTRVIKEGGQGAVFEGRDEVGTVVAVKEMLDRFADEQERSDAVKRFAAEAETLRKLSHPRIPRIFASFNDAGRHYLVMEYIIGEDLEDLVAREGPLPEERVLAWADDLCDVLGYLHGEGLIYRDMKPSNVMIERPAGTLKVIDFGIAKVFQPQSRGTQIGTPGYAPPEQYQGLATRVSDVYALGATLHHLLSGRDPRDHQPFTYPPLTAVTRRTADAVARATQMRQEDRFQSITEFREALRPPTATRPAAQAGPAATTTGPPQPATGGVVVVPSTAARSAASVAPPPPPVPVSSVPGSAVQGAAPGRAGGAQPSPAPTPAPASKGVAPTSALPTPKPATPSARRGSPLPWILGLLLVLVFGAAGFYFLVQPGGGSQGTAATATAQVLVARPFEVRDLEIVVAPGSSAAAVNDAFAAAFLQLARLDCGCEPQVQAGTLVYRFGEEPRQLEIAADGVRYRASLEATLLVPGL